ncbi:MAG: nucleotidyltransferase family protein, partial [Clostridia bacterium]
MIISAIIAEYNPFHNGHLLHIQETIKNTKCDYLIVVLSGSITQRGTPSIISKWDRAKAAILAGADLVIELPAPFSLASAQNFSFAAVSLLESLKIVDFLSFGSESGDIDELAKVATVSDSFEVYEQTFENLKSGISYSVAKQISIAAAKNCDENILTSSNNILAVEYLIALNRLGSKITPYTYKRDTVNHNDLTPNGDFASATAIRKMIFESKPFEKYLPSYSFEMIQNANIASLDFIDFGIMPLLRSYSISSFKDVPEISEGLDHRILKNLYLST